MSVYIPGMKMPKSCCDCPLFKSNISGQLFCKGKMVAFGKEDAEWLPKTTPNWCPLVPVPDHGRLIDADANLSVMRQVLDNPYTDHGKIDTAMLKACIKMFEETPTIIPADKAEEGET